MGHVYINGKEISNPVAKFFIKLLAVLVGVLVVALGLLLVLPAVGIVVAGALGIALISVLLVVLAVPVFAVGGSVLGLLCAPLAAVSSICGGRRQRRGHWD